MTDMLFPMADPPEQPDLSAGQRLTLRQHADIERGVHPLTGEPTRPDLGTCGDCALRIQYGAHGYPKCHREVAGRRIYVMHSARTDVRAFWPACPAHQPVVTNPLT
jgi:hypothetical protein